MLSTEVIKIVYNTIKYWRYRNSQGFIVVWITGWYNRFGGFWSLTRTPRFKVCWNWRLYEGLGWNFIPTIRYTFFRKMEDVERATKMINLNFYTSVLPLLWTFGHPKGLSLTDLSRFLSYNTAKLARLDHCKGSISVGMDADFVIWNPDEKITVRRYRD